MKQYSEYRTKYTWFDIILACLLAVMFGFFSFCTLSSGHTFISDDYAAYLLEAFSIANGDFDEQVKRNYILHPSPISDEANQEQELVYVWGYPLMLAPIYKVFGFDRTDYHSLVYYALPTAVSFAGLGAFMFLFMRRRFGWSAALLLTVLCCLNIHVFWDTGSIQTDIPFFMLSVLLYLLVEIYLSSNHRVFWGVLLGMAMWLTHETRLNGMTVCAAVAAAHLFFFVKERQEKDQKPSAWVQLLPYLVFGALVLITEYLWLRPATSNMSDFGDSTQKSFVTNITYYIRMMHEWLDTFWFYGDLRRYNGPYMMYITMALCLLGMIVHGIRHNTHLTVLLLGTLAVLVSLPYVQGHRYLFNIMPLIILFAAYGLQFLFKLLTGKFKEPFRKGIAGVLWIVSVLGCIGPIRYIHAYSRSMYQIRGNPKAITDTYSDESIAMYHYIQENTAEDCTIAFIKPRSLYLNTLRMGFNPEENGHVLEDADYFLIFNNGGQGDLLEEAPQFEKIYGNVLLSLYQNTQRTMSDSLTD